jgi:hypothetical protein
MAKKANPRNVSEADKVKNVVFQTVQNRFRKLMPTIKHFKIGESGMIATQRLSKDDYRTTYQKIEVLYTSKNSALIDQLESLIIRYCMRYYKSKCDNKTTVSLGDMTNVNGMYIIYIVFNVND